MQLSQSSTLAPAHGPFLWAIRVDWRRGHAGGFVEVTCILQPQIRLPYALERREVALEFA
ncbi:MAG: hypothetical protein KDB22_27210 [Planctomycetales bacterium]|nr:hypothetical protein [Planctomycetales bacterium]